jgi:hypothetical protein
LEHPPPPPDPHDNLSPTSAYSNTHTPLAQPQEFNFGLPLSSNPPPVTNTTAHRDNAANPDIHSVAPLQINHQQPTEKSTIVEVPDKPLDPVEPHTEEVGFDPFVPFDNLPDERPRVITVRAIIVGIIAGSLVNASNVFLGLKSGWTFTANLFGAIIGFGIISLFSKMLSEDFPILGGSFGPRENNIVQTAATAAGGMSNVFVSAFPAMYQLGLLGKTPADDYWRLVAITAVGGFFGLFFATPRKFSIKNCI